MSFGFSVGDFVAVGELALRIYRECRDAPAQFAAISTEVSSLHLVLKDVDHSVRERDLSPEKEADLVRICDGCRSVLTDLDALLRKYRNVGKQTRWTWDRLKWHQSDITELRSRVISNVGILSAFYNSLNSSMTSQIEKQLTQLALEIQSGKREGSVITVDSMKASQGGDEGVWWEIKRELEGAGITEETINQHREFITNWLVNAMQSGQLEEGVVESVHHEESEKVRKNAENSEIRSFEDGLYPASNFGSERLVSDESNSENESDEFLSAANQKIAKLHRLGWDAIEESFYGKARLHFKKANDLAIMAFGAHSRKAKECFKVLEEVAMYEKSPKYDVPPHYQGIYTSSGFDMLGTLGKVATRMNPEFDIGKVDLSCAFVVCDSTEYDDPIIYVSETFERLTGYNRHEVLGKNCRFLQAPDGHVVAATRRHYVDNDSAYYLKERIANKREAQRSLINYRKGGQPFMNLLTVIPITGEDNVNIRYFVGFLVDMISPPESLLRIDPSGLFTGDFSKIEPGLAKQIELTDKVLMDNTDDLIYIISLEGLFLYLSPSSASVLEYDSSELLGTALSSICHPSDITQVSRELQDSSTRTSVDLLFRIRRKTSGYVWLESLGSHHEERDTGMRYIILAGRKLPTYTLYRCDIMAAGGIGDSESELWAKLSTSGTILFVSSNVQTLLGQAPDALIGKRFQALMRAKSRLSFDEALQKARTGKCASSRHEVLNQGLVLQAQTTLYPGDVFENGGPGYVIVQTQFLTLSPQLATLAHTSHSGVDTSAPSVTLLPRTITSSGFVSRNAALNLEDNLFSALATTRCSNWVHELQQLKESNRLLAAELAGLLSTKQKGEGRAKV